MESEPSDNNVTESPTGKIWQVPTAEMTGWLDSLNATNLVLLVVGNPFFNSVTGWHDIRVYRFARAFEALGFTPLVMCRWTTAVTEVAGTYDGIAFRRLTKPAKLFFPPTRSVTATVSPATGLVVAATPNGRLSQKADVVGSDHAGSGSVTDSAIPARSGENPRGIAATRYRWAQDVAECLRIGESGRRVWRFIYRQATAIIRLPFRAYRVARAARNRTFRAAKWTVRVARNHTVRAVKWIVAPWTRYLNLGFSRDFERAVRSLRPCFIYAADLNTLLPASRLARRYTVPLVYDSHEYFLSCAEHEWMNPARRFIDKLACRYLEARLIPRANRLISVSDGLVKEFSRRFPHVDCLCVRNMLPLTAASSRNNRIRAQTGISARTRIALYIGFITGGRGISELLKAVSYLPDNIVIVFLGGGRHLGLRRREAVECGVDDKVYFLGHVPQHEVLSYAAAADCGLSLIQPTCFSYYHSLPNKIFQFALSGTPMLCSDFPDMASLVKAYDMGDVCDPTEPRAISDTIVRLLSDPIRWNEMSANCLQAARTELNWESEARKLSFCTDFARSYV